MPAEHEASPTSFAELARMPDRVLPLDVGAALIAADACPGLDVRGVIGRFDELAAAVRPVVEERRNPLARLWALTHYLFDEVGLRGNVTDYYDPDNSYIHRVLERQLGIPVTLSVVYIEVARRVDVPLHGVGFPGHFLLKHCREPEVYVDPFAADRFLSQPDCEQLLRRFFGDSAELTPEHLSIVSPRQILVRMLANLKAIYARQGEAELAIAASSRILMLAPNAAAEYRDRGLLHWRLEAFRYAHADLTQYLLRRPDADDQASVEQVLREIQQRLSMLH